jgi:hypothetical protein
MMSVAAKLSASDKDCGAFGRNLKPFLAERFNKAFIIVKMQSASVKQHLISKTLSK